MTTDYILYRSGGYKFQLAADARTVLSFYPGRTIETAHILLHSEGTLICRAGYAWDGISGPFFVVDRDSTMRATLVHDALYQLMSDGMLDWSFKEAADLEFKRLLKQDGLNSVSCWAFYRAVKRFGGLNRNPDSPGARKREIRQAP